MRIHPTFLPIVLSLAAACGSFGQEGARPLRDLGKSYFPFTPVKSAEEWAVRKEEIKQRILVSTGLWPMPEKTPLKAQVYGRIERDDYTVEKVVLESLPGHFVTGNLYLPKKKPAKMPGILCPHGHWPNGRFMDLGEGTPAQKKEIEAGAETYVSAARSPLQARCVQLARMGCAVFHYDMLGYADSIQYPEHRHGRRDAEGHIFLSAQAENSLQTYFGLQTWNSVRATDFLLSLENIDANRIGCTGASGGGTQTMISSGIDDRITASFPCVMVSTAMQGGCTCENSHHLRINQGNIDIAAISAPRPMGMTAADDWTKELETKGFPDLKKLYTQLGVADQVEAHFDIKFPHNYNQVSRRHMYRFFNRHFKLGFPDDVDERDFVFTPKEQLSVWDKEHPAPSGDKVGAPHERAVCAWMTGQDEKSLSKLMKPQDKAEAEKAAKVLGGGWEVLIGRRLPKAEEVKFELGQKEEKDGYLFMDGVTKYGPANENVTCSFLYPKDWDGKVVLWLSLNGKNAIMKDGAPTKEAKKLLAAKIAIACPELYLPGVKENPKVASNQAPKPDSFYDFSGYTYGYNPSLLAQRIRDALTTVVMMKNHPKHTTTQIIVAGGDGAGAIAAGTAFAAKEIINGVVIDSGDFDFAKLTNVWEENFIPGAVKYGGMAGLLALSAPLPVAASNEADRAAAAAFYKVAGSKGGVSALGEGGLAGKVLEMSK